MSCNSFGQENEIIITGSVKYNFQSEFPPLPRCHASEENEMFQFVWKIKTRDNTTRNERNADSVYQHFN